MRYTVIGAGKSGMAAARLLHENGETVFVSEHSPAEERTAALAALRELGIAAEFGGHSARALEGAECIVVSPGVPPETPILLEAARRGIRIISELELAARHLQNPLIAVTGTNGKTTTTTLIAYILNHAGKPAVCAGNIGTPLAALVGTLAKDVIIVVEASSYQLDRIETFCPDVAVILNITPDHLSYHKSFENYCAAKYKIFLNQTSKNILVLNAEDKLSAQIAGKARARILYFGKRRIKPGAWLADSRLYIADGLREEEDIMSTLDIRLPGEHNAYNSMAAALAARAFEVRNEDIRDSLMSFRGVEHRLESVLEHRGVEYVNDSKATNVNATWYALGSYTRPIVWIAGGRGEENDYSPLDELVRERVRIVISIGEEARNIFNHFSSFTRCITAESLAGAVRIAAQNAQQGYVVLFSPACKSFDMFTNYEHRGESFKQLLREL